jgi:hypothetical protein
MAIPPFAFYGVMASIVLSAGCIVISIQEIEE